MADAWEYLMTGRWAEVGDQREQKAGDQEDGPGCAAWQNDWN